MRRDFQDATIAVVKAGEAPDLHRAPHTVARDGALIGARSQCLTSSAIEQQLIAPNRLANIVVGCLLLLPCAYL